MVKDIVAACPCPHLRNMTAQAPTSFQGVHGDLKQNLGIRLPSESLKRSWYRVMVKNMGSSFRLCHAFTGGPAFLKT